MRRGLDAGLVRAAAEASGLTPASAASAVESYFSALAGLVRRLPFGTPRRIYSPSRFASESFVATLPGLGRVGPAYSRYVRWRASEARGSRLVGRAEARARWRGAAAEEEAAKVLAGGSADVRRVRSLPPSSVATRVWLYVDGGRRSARQMIWNGDEI